MELSGVGQVAVAFRESSGVLGKLFGKPEVIRTVTINESGDVLVAASSMKNGHVARTMDAGADFASLSSSDQQVVKGLRELLTADHGHRPANLHASLDNAFRDTWTAGVEVQNLTGHAHSFEANASDAFVQQAKQLSHHVLQENPGKARGTTFGDWVAHAFRLDEIS